MTKTVEKKTQYKKGLWTVEEDKMLTDYVKVNGKGQWNRIAKKTGMSSIPSISYFLCVVTNCDVVGLKRCGKSCRLRWMNYLSPSVNRSNFTDDEEDLIIRLHKLLGNRWSLIAKRVPGRTDNQVKNYWNTHLSKKLGIRDQGRRSVGDSNLVLNSGGKSVDVRENSATETTSRACDDRTESNTVEDHKGSLQRCSLNSEDTQETVMDEGFLNSLWVSDDDLLQFMDGYSLI